MTTEQNLSALVEEAEKWDALLVKDWKACSCHHNCGLLWAGGEMHIATVQHENEDSDCAQPSHEQCRDLMDGIVRFRTLVPALAAAVRRLEEELEAATTQLAKKFKTLEEIARERDAVRKQAAEWEVQAQDFRDRLVKAEEFLRVVTLERDHAQRVEVTDALLRAEAAEKRLADLRGKVEGLGWYACSDGGPHVSRSEVLALVSP
jgi:hypothetical protein